MRVHVELERHPRLDAPQVTIPLESWPAQERPSEVLYLGGPLPDPPTSESIDDSGYPERERVQARTIQWMADPLGWRLSEALDRHVRTDACERIDEPDFPEENKLFLARYLHCTNRIMGSYWRFQAQLEPLAREIARRKGRPARVRSSWSTPCTTSRPAIWRVS